MWTRQRLAHRQSASDDDDCIGGQIADCHGGFGEAFSRVQHVHFGGDDVNDQHLVVLGQQNGIGQPDVASARNAYPHVTELPLCFAGAFSVIRNFLPASRGF